MKKYNIIFCDDDKEFLDLISLNFISSFNNIEFNIYKFLSLEQLTEFVTNKQVDVLFLDYNFKKENSFDYLEKHNINKFKDADFFKKNNKIKITLNGKEFLYDVFSAYIVESDYDYLKTNFNNESDYQNYINDITSKSLYKSPIKVNSNDKIVTLSTCTYEFDDARMVIHGRLV